MKTETTIHVTANHSSGSYWLAADQHNTSLIKAAMEEIYRQLPVLSPGSLSWLGSDIDGEHLMLTVDMTDYSDHMHQSEQMGLAHKIARDVFANIGLEVEMDAYSGLPCTAQDNKVVIRFKIAQELVWQAQRRAEFNAYQDLTEQERDNRPDGHLAQRLCDEEPGTISVDLFNLGSALRGLADEVVTLSAWQPRKQPEELDSPWVADLPDIAPTDDALQLARSLEEYAIRLRRVAAIADLDMAEAQKSQ